MGVMLFSPHCTCGHLHVGETVGGGKQVTQFYNELFFHKGLIYICEIRMIWCYFQIKEEPFIFTPKTSFTRIPCVSTGGVRGQREPAGACFCSKETLTRSIPG